MNKGKFRLLMSSNDPADRFLVYTPNTLPYNASAPMRNTVPFIPISFEEGRVVIDPEFPKELLNEGIVQFISSMNNSVTPNQLQDQQFIREQLRLDHIRSELRHLGSVVEDDVRNIDFLHYRQFLYLQMQKS